LVSYNASFNTFILPQQIESVIDKMPPLSSNILNIIPSPGTAILMQQKLGTNIIPIWTLQQGEIPIAILSGEGIWRWRFYEYKNLNIYFHCAIHEYIPYLAKYATENLQIVENIID
jgi:hypothetical protein